MADEFQIGSGNWWDSPRTRHDNNSSPSSSTLSGMSFIQNPMDSHVSVSGSTSMVSDPNLQIIGLGLSSQPVSDWNQTLMRGGKAESSFQQESGMGSSTQDHWTHKLYSGSSEDSSINDYKQINPGLSLDQSQFSPQISSNNFQMDPNTAYGNTSTTFQGLLGLENQQQQSSSNYGYPPNYGETLSCWPKFPQFLGNSPPKQTPPNSQLQFSNSTQFWNPAAGPVNDVRSSFFPSSPSQFSSPNFEEKPKQNTPEAKDFSTVGKKNSCEASSKRPRNETPSPLPAFKVRKEKMGDRITALQQLVSPFGKTDTASVLSEAIEYIKFLHEQVGVLSNPYLKSGASMHHQQNIDKSKEPEGPKPDLRSRGLCLVPVSSTFPVTHETTVDFWTPTFGGTFR